MFLSYNGTRYHGWQIQPGAVTVQSTLEQSLSLILNEEIKTTGAGRTDSGVHATFFCAHFESLKPDLDTNENFIFRLNRFLPPDIAIKSLRKVFHGAHARYSALSRTYKYYISRSKDPFVANSSWYIYGQIDVNLMNEACRIILNHTDFTSFSRLHSDNKTNICNVYDAYWEEKGECLIFTIKADRFLRNMVRAIVGTMISVGEHKTDVTGFEDILNALDRCRAGKSAPAEGLFLTDIEYPPEIFM